MSATGSMVGARSGGGETEVDESEDANESVEAVEEVEGVLLHR